MHLELTIGSNHWSGRRDSNPRPRAWEAPTLPTELRPPRREAAIVTHPAHPAHPGGGGVVGGVGGGVGGGDGFRGTGGGGLSRDMGRVGRRTGFRFREVFARRK